MEARMRLTITGSMQSGVSGAIQYRRHVVQCDQMRREQGGDHQRQNRILGAAHRVGA